MIHLFRARHTFVLNNRDMYLEQKKHFDLKSRDTL